MWTLCAVSSTSFQSHSEARKLCTSGEVPCAEISVITGSETLHGVGIIGCTRDIAFKYILAIRQSLEKKRKIVSNCGEVIAKKKRMGWLLCVTWHISKISQSRDKYASLEKAAGNPNHTLSYQSHSALRLLSEAMSMQGTWIHCGGINAAIS